MSRHGGYAGGQEQTRFSPLGAKLYFHVYKFSEKIFYSIDHHDGRLVVWLQTKNRRAALFTLIPRNNTCIVKRLALKTIKAI